MTSKRLRPAERKKRFRSRLETIARKIREMDEECEEYIQLGSDKPEWMAAVKLREAALYIET